MKLQSMKTSKGKGKPNCGDKFIKMQNGSVISNKSEFPMEPFKGTKSYLTKFDYNNIVLNPGEKRKSDADLKNEMHLNQEKNTKYDPLKVMSKLEKFSGIWNDCPIVENPKSNFEVVPMHETALYSRENNFQHRTERQREPELRKWSVQYGNEKAQFEKHFQETNNHHTNLHENNTKVKINKNKNNKSKDEIIEDNITVFGKNDSKVSEMKRKKAVQEQNQLHADKKNIIKNALASMDSKQQVNKKIVFSDGEDDDETQNILVGNKTKRQTLFDDDDDSSVADLELKVNSQFEGKKGQKLLELQSKFASDSRFALDSRFHDSESENEVVSTTENLDINKEKKRQLEILETIVKQPIRPLFETRKVTCKKYDEPLMVRFDPTREDHQKYLLKRQKPLEEKEEINVKKKKLKKESKSLSNIEESKARVSSEKVYAVKEDLKEALKKENKTEFSLLKLFGSKGGCAVKARNCSRLLLED